MTPPRVIVVGAGVAGVAAAWRLQQQGCDVTVLEARDVVGGKTAAVRRDGFIVNTGATVLAGSYQAMFGLAAEVGVADRITTPPAVIGVVRDGRVHELRGEGLGALVDFVRTPLLSARSKLLLAKVAPDLLRARRGAVYDRHDLRAQLDTETVAEYCERKLNREILNHLLSPVLGGIFVTDGARMSVANLWFTLWKVLLSGLRGYTEGIDFLARAVAERLDVRTSAEVTRVRRTADGVTVDWLSAEGPQEATVDGVVLTVPAPRAAALVPEMDPETRDILLTGFEQASYIALRFGLSEPPRSRALLTVAGPDALGGIATVMYEHALSAGSAPAGRGLLGVLMYDDWASTRLQLTDDELVGAVLPLLERIEPGLGQTVQFAEVTRWSPAAIRTTHRTHQLIARLDRRLDRADRIQLAGDYLCMPSVNGSIVSGETAAARLVGALGSPGTSAAHLTA